MNIKNETGMDLAIHLFQQALISAYEAISEVYCGAGIPQKRSEAAL
jgi:hypothetical protein